MSGQLHGPLLEVRRSAVPLQLAATVRPMRADELPWVVHSWSESHKDAPKCRRLSWSDYKALVVPRLREALARPDCTVLVCDGEQPTRGVGWMAFSRWPSIDVVHWIYTAFEYRRRGVMSALLASLRSRVAYTHQAAIKRGQVRADLWIAEKLRASGTTVSHAPYKEWSK